MNHTLETFTTAGPALTTEVTGGVCVGMDFYFWSNNLFYKTLLHLFKFSRNKFWLITTRFFQ